MEENEISLDDIMPVDLDHAIVILTEIYASSLETIGKMSEREFMSATHHSAGMAIRNAWKLWWSDDTSRGWSAIKPQIVAWFNGIDIYHADDMSGIIMTSFHRSATGKSRDMEGQLKVYRKHWLKQGFKDGIYDQNRRS